MRREIVVFERNLAQYGDVDPKPELDFRLVRQALPVGAQPLAIVTGEGFNIVDGQFYTRDEVRKFAEEQSGYNADV
jgi:hypothetical protein